MEKTFQIKFLLVLQLEVKRALQKFCPRSKTFHGQDFVKLCGCNFGCGNLELKFRGGMHQIKAM